MITTYIVNLESRKDRLNSILEQFKGREEFNITIQKATEDENGAKGLWDTVKKIIHYANQNQFPYVLICEDDHVFTPSYSKGKLVSYINQATRLDADILLGGVSTFHQTLKLTRDLFWINKFTGFQFTIIFEKSYQKLLDAEFHKYNHIDLLVSSIFSNIITIHPFISIQKEFGYSDINSYYTDHPGYINHLFTLYSERLEKLNFIQKFYKERSLKTYTNVNTSIETYVFKKKQTKNTHILHQFSNKDEFSINIISYSEKTDFKYIIKNILEKSLSKDEDLIIITTEDYMFNSKYNENAFIKEVIRAYTLGADVLLGNGTVENIVPLSKSLCWINQFRKSNFIVIYKKFYSKILDKSHSIKGLSDFFLLLSHTTMNKFLLLAISSNNYKQHINNQIFTND